jgi:hypothetical protein
MAQWVSLGGEFPRRPATNTQEQQKPEQESHGWKAWRKEDEG